MLIADVPTNLYEDALAYEYDTSEEACKCIYKYYTDYLFLNPSLLLVRTKSRCTQAD